MLIHDRILIIDWQMLLHNPLRACTQVCCDASRGTHNSFFLTSFRNNNQIDIRTQLRLTATRRLSSLFSRTVTNTNNNEFSFFRALQSHKPESVAVKHSKSGRLFTYADLNADIIRSKEQLVRKYGGTPSSLSGQRVAFLAENSYDYVGTVFLPSTILSYL